MRADRQGEGLGARLLVAGLEHARAAGCGRMILEVRADNLGAQALYRRHRFVEVHVRRRYYADGTDALILSADLAMRPPDRSL